MSDRYQRIQTMKNDYNLTLLCATLEVSRSGYHAWRTRQPSARQQANARILEEIGQLREGPECCYGRPRLTRKLQSRGYECSENRIARLMREHDLRAQAPHQRCAACFLCEAFPGKIFNVDQYGIDSSAPRQRHRCRAKIGSPSKGIPVTSLGGAERVR